MNYTHIAANSGTPVNVGNATGSKLHTVTVNTKGAAANLLTIADSKGTIAIIDTTAGPNWWLYDVDANGQLTATLNTGTPADVTLTWQ